MLEEDYYIHCHDNCPFIPELNLDISNHKLYSKCSKFENHSFVYYLNKEKNSNYNYSFISEKGEFFSINKKKNIYRCDKCQKQIDNLIYCESCEKILCIPCHNIINSKINLNSDNNSKRHYYLPINLLNTHCIQHNKKFTSYCNKCRINVCESCIIHQYHSLISFYDLIPSKMTRKKIKNLFNSEKEQLTKIKNKFNKINSEEKTLDDCHDNYINKKTIEYQLKLFIYRDFVQRLNKKELNYYSLLNFNNIQSKFDLISPNIIHYLDDTKKNSDKIANFFQENRNILQKKKIIMKKEETNKATFLLSFNNNSLFKNIGFIAGFNNGEIKLYGIDFNEKYSSKIFNSSILYIGSLSNNSILITSSFCGKIFSFDGEELLIKNSLEIKNVFISMIKIIENQNNLDIISLIKPGRLLIWKYIKNINDYQTFQEIKEDNFDYCDILKLNNYKKEENKFNFVCTLNKIFLKSDKLYPNESQLVFFELKKKIINEKVTESYEKTKIFKFNKYDLILSSYENSLIQIDKNNLLLVANKKNDISSLLILFNLEYMEIITIYESQMIKSIHYIKLNYLIIDIEENNSHYLKEVKYIGNEIIFEKFKIDIDSWVNSIALSDHNSLAVST